jgi:hypothetical protein
MAETPYKVSQANVGKQERGIVGGILSARAAQYQYIRKRERSMYIAMLVNIL